MHVSTTRTVFRALGLLESRWLRLLEESFLIAREGVALNYMYYDLQSIQRSVCDVGVDLDANGLMSLRVPAPTADGPPLQAEPPARTKPRRL